MSTTTHKQLCWNCDGYVHVYEITCPYCGVSLSEKQKETPKEEPSLSQSIEEKTAHAIGDFSPPYPGGYGANLHEQSFDAKSTETPKTETQEDVKNPLQILLLLLPGTLFFLLGLTTLFFSQEGYLVLEFKSKFWVLYLLLSLPLLWAGYRMLFPKRREQTTRFDAQNFTNPLER